MIVLWSDFFLPLSVKCPSLSILSSWILDSSACVVIM